MPFIVRALCFNYKETTRYTWVDVNAVEKEIMYKTLKIIYLQAGDIY